MKKYILPVLLLCLGMLSCAKSQNEGVRGTWLTNVDSEVLDSRENIVKAIELLDSLNFNTVFPVVWNKGQTLYPSEVMGGLTGQSIDSAYLGRDPLRELIEEAHKRDIKVVAWFEFGFSSSHEKSEEVILKIKPEWKSRNYQGEVVTKNGFTWMNGFKPEVQEFMLSLILEVVKNYDIDGIQGDDRLPAMPSEAGYDEYTVSLYKAQHKGQSPPKDHMDSAWIEWRADLLNEFMAEIYHEVKKADSETIVSMAPSIYPWSKEQYLQDWPTWVEEGYVDLVIPQVYRYDIEDYESALSKIVNEQISKEKMNIFYPGILLQVGDYNPTKEVLRDMINVNRKHSINGEVYFFYEGIKKYSDIFWKEFYNNEIKFPDLLNE